MKHVNIFVLVVCILFILVTIAFATNKIVVSWTPNVSFPKAYFITQQPSFPPKGNPLLQYQMHQNNLVNDKTMNTNNSFGKQMGIYGLEFLGCEVAAIPILYWAGYGFSQTGEIDPCIYYYVLSNIAITSTFCWGTGELLNQNGSWYKTAIGTSVCTLAGSFFAYKSIKYGGIDGYTTYIAFITPALGAVIGYNF